MSFGKSLLAIGALAPLAALAQSGAWGQCGGVNWTGPKTCIAGYTCTYVNDFYYQCIPGSAATTTVASSTRTTTTPGSTASASTGLNALAKAAGKVYFGSAVDNSELSDTPYVALFHDSKEFGQTTPGNAQKWDATEPSRGSFRYTSAEQVIQFAAVSKMLVRGHTLVWHSQLPSWVSNGGFNNATLISVMENHIANVAGQFAGRVYAWDVVNEMFNEDGTFRSSVFYNTIGQRFIDIALRAARKADPAAKLYVNEYNIDGTGSKSTGMYNLVKRLKAEGVPLDGVGTQSHLIVGAVPTTLQTNWASFASLGVDVAITELDIRMTLPVTNALLTQQAKDYYSVVAACMAIPRCVGITTWGFSDNHSWIPGVFPGEGAALIWDGNLAKKPAYFGIEKALRGVPF